MSVRVCERVDGWLSSSTRRANRAEAPYHLVGLRRNIIDARSQCPVSAESAAAFEARLDEYVYRSERRNVGVYVCKFIGAVKRWNLISV